MLVTYKPCYRANLKKVAGVATDLFDPMSRGVPMSIFATASFSGGLGQLVSGFVVAAKGWRWIHWHQLIINGILMLLIALLFRETRGPVLLSRKAQALNAHEQTTREKREDRLVPYPKSAISWKVKGDEDRTNLKRMIKLSLTRPFC